MPDPIQVNITPSHAPTTSPLPAHWMKDMPAVVQPIMFITDARLGLNYFDLRSSGEARGEGEAD